MGTAFFPTQPPTLTPTPATLSLPLREIPKPVKAGQNQECGQPPLVPSLSSLTAVGKLPLVFLGLNSGG